MIGPLIAAGASLAANWLGNKSTQKTNAANIAADNERNAANIAHQKEFAQSGIQWKVADAEKAGVHPLFALGAQTTSFSPTAVGAQSQPSSFSGLADAGQNIGRAIDATRSTPASAMALQLGKIQLEGAQLDNDLKRTQLASAIQTNMPAHPGLPGPFTRSVVDGQGDSGQYDTTLPALHHTNTPQYTPNLRAFGKDIATSPAFSDAQSWEDRYGDESPAAFIINQISSINDAWRNIRPVYKRQVLDKLRR